MFDYILFIFYNSIQQKGDVSPESYEQLLNSTSALPVYLHGIDREKFTFYFHWGTEWFHNVQSTSYHSYCYDKCAAEVDSGISSTTDIVIIAINLSSVTSPRHFHHRSNSLYFHDLFTYCSFCLSKRD